MNDARPPRIRITDLDARRLRLVLTEEALRLAELEAEIARAQIVPRDRISPDTITMNSRVRYRDQHGNEHDVTLVYPDDAGPGHVSVTSPIGASLLGLRVGDTINWDSSVTPHRLTILAVHYQPEAEGARAR